MARYCAHCGNQLTEGEKFCPVCGSPVERPEGGKNTAPQPGPRSQQPAGSFQPKGDLPHQSGRGKWIALVIGLMLAAVGAGIFFARQKDDKSAADTKPPVTQEEKKQEVPRKPANGAAQGEKSQKDANQSYGKITGTDVRMRASYSTDSDVLGYFDNGETVTILDDVTSGGQRWLKVQRSDGSVGWVSADFCAEH